MVCALLLPTLVLPATRLAALPASFYSDSTSRANGGIALVGDSLTYSYWSGLPASFVAEKWGPFQLEARSGRYTTMTSSSATSGLDAVRRIRAGGFDPPVWIVALGTNDLWRTYSIPGATAVLIDTMMKEIGTGHRVVWVNVYNRDSLTQAIAFNNELLAAVGRHPQLTVADWFSVISANPQWLTADGVHLNLTGSIARNEFVAHAGLVPPPPPLVCDPTPAAATQSPQPTEFTLAAEARAPAVRLCHS